MPLRLLFAGPTLMIADVDLWLNAHVSGNADRVAICGGYSLCNRTTHFGNLSRRSADFQQQGPTDINP